MTLEEYKQSGIKCNSNLEYRLSSFNTEGKESENPTTSSLCLLSKSTYKIKDLNPIFIVECKLSTS